MTNDWAAMNVAYTCRHCDAANRAEVGPGHGSLACSQCGQTVQVPPGAVDEGQVRRCLVCPSVDLFVRKDFPQRLGVTIVVLGLLASCVAWGYGRVVLTFGILFATALVDVVLYVVVPNALMCYRCGAMYRGVADMAAHQSFDLETHERHRQEKIRTARMKGVESRG